MSQQQVLALLVRAIKTFLQAFFATLAAGMLTTGIDGAAIKALIIGAFAAGISALMNAFIKPAEAK